MQKISNFFGHFLDPEILEITQSWSWYFRIAKQSGIGIPVDTSIEALYWDVQAYGTREEQVDQEQEAESRKPCISLSTDKTGTRVWPQCIHLDMDQGQDHVSCKPLSELLQSLQHNCTLINPF